MQIKADWTTALAAARRGELEPALAAREVESGAPLPDYFFGRCLASAGLQLDEAVAALRTAHAAAPGNAIIPFALALALLRQAQPETLREAAALYAAHGLPHDLDLLGQTVLAMELQLRPVPAGAEATQPPWPAFLEVPQPQDVITSTPPGEAAALPGKTLPGMAKAMAEVESKLMAFDQPGAVALAHEWLARGADAGDLHLGAGMAAGELGWLDLARAHLARAIALEPDLQYSRTFLGHAHWRAGNFELALALWRSLAVEGPYDYGRHYHLALGHAALGDTASAMQAMDLALSAFYYDTRHVFIERLYQRWLRHLQANPSPS